MKQIRIGLVGAGVVGSNLLQLLEKNKKTIQTRNQLDIEVVAIATRTPSKVQGFAQIPVSTDPLSITQNPNVDLVVELIGGTTTAYTIVQNALSNGKPVITGGVV